MGGTSCYYASAGTAYSGCTSSPNDSVLSAGAIAGIVIGSLLGIALIIFLVVLIYKLAHRNPSLPRDNYNRNVYNVPMNMNHHQQSIRRPEMYIPTKSPIYSEAPMNNGYYENS